MMRLTRSSGEKPRAVVTADTGATTILPQEVRRFTDIADAWWDEEGDFAPLHRINPARIGYIRQALIAHFGRDTAALRPFSGLTICDVGCGGGLTAEPMARMGFAVTGVDAGDRNIAIAKHHAGSHGLDIDYRVATAEQLRDEAGCYDAVLALEIVEHVSDPALFLKSLSAILRPGGALVMSTLNRTLKSLALAKIGAEYILRWVPPGTHDWRMFLRPSELTRLIFQSGMEVAGLSGLVYNPLTNGWSLSRDVDINYLLVARKPTA